MHMRKTNTQNKAIKLTHSRQKVWWSHLECRMTSLSTQLCRSTWCRHIHPSTSSANCCWRNLNPWRHRGCHGDAKSRTRTHMLPAVYPQWPYMSRSGYLQRTMTEIEDCVISQGPVVVGLQTDETDFEKKPTRFVKGCIIYVYVRK